MSKPLYINILSKTAEVSGNQISILGSINATVPAGCFLSIIGPSGCGKSTLLRAIMGLDMAFQGDIKVGGNLVKGPGLDRGIVFQEPRLLPWNSVRKNIEFAAPDSASRAEVSSKVNRLLELFGLAEFAEAWPKQLSGGMLQRVAIARAMLNLPDVLLMDEPFAALDAHTKGILQSELALIFAEQETTTILVTHDVEEAVFLSDYIIILSERPGTLAHFLKIDLARPRDKTHNDFVKLRFNILNLAF